MWEYDIALSFAGEDRQYVKEVAQCLKSDGIKVFYDEFEKVNLWGKDLYTHLSWVYRESAKYTVVFLSKSYKEKLWTKHELQNAQARAFEESEEYLLPVRFDNTEIPGIRPTINYIDLKDVTPAELAAMIKEKIGKMSFDGDDIVSFVYPPPFPWADLLFYGGNHNRRKYGEREVWRNHHQITFLARPKRKIEVEVAMAQAVEAKNVVTIAFMFSGRRYMMGNLDAILIEFISKYKLDWITYQDAGRFKLWTIHGDILIRYLPQLEHIGWVKNKFQVPPLWHSGPRSGSGDPADSVGMEFALLEPGTDEQNEEKQTLPESVEFILDNYRFQGRDRLISFLLDNGHKLEMLKGLVGCYKDYFGNEAVLTLRVLPHGEDRIPKRSLLISIYTNNLMENDHPVLERFIEECVKNRFGDGAELNEEDRILFQTKPLSEAGEIFPNL